MAKPGVKVPASRVPKNSEGVTKLPLAAGDKQIEEQHLRIGQAADVGPAPTSRVYTRDYSKSKRSPGDVDLVTEALGNPLGL